MTAMSCVPRLGFMGNVMVVLLITFIDEPTSFLFDHFNILLVQRVCKVI